MYSKEITELATKLAQQQGFDIIKATPAWDGDPMFLIEKSWWGQKVGTPVFITIEKGVPRKVVGIESLYYYLNVWKV